MAQVSFPKQSQERQPGREAPMRPRPKEDGAWYRGSGKLLGKTALITGADSGIGRSVAVFFAREGADIVALYYDEHEDAAVTKEMVRREGRRCILVSGDVSDPSFCRRSADVAAGEFGGINILVNNAAYQPLQPEIDKISESEIEKVFRINIFSFFYLSGRALRYMKEGDTIINSTSVVAYRGHPELLGYASTKGAIVALMRSLALSLIDRGIRVNAVAPGPVWTPLTVSSFPEEKVEKFGSSAPMKRAAQPEEIAPSYVFLASRDSSYVTGQVLHPNGGYVLNT